MAGKSSPGAAARIVLVDDHPLVRYGVAQRLADEAGLAVCGEAGDVKEALQVIGRLRPDLAVVDISLPGRDGIELIKEIKSRYPATRVLVLSLHDERLYAERALRAGARGYVMKSAPPRDLVAAVRRVLAGEIVVGSEIVGQVLARVAGDAKQARSPLDRLTDRELEIVRLIGEGRTRGEIAASLHLSPKTIEAHRARVRAKLGLGSVSELRRFAIEVVRDEAAALGRT
jgi:DNA-binding NarL/FixJ family response regulator